MRGENIRLFLLIVIPLTIFGETILITDDPKLDYDFHDQELVNTTKPKTNTSFKDSELETEENVIDSVESDKRPTNDTILEITTESILTTVNSRVPLCSMDQDKFNLKISQLLEKFVPDLLKLRPIERGVLAKFYLKNGKLIINKDFKIVGQPVCTEIDDKTKEYEIMLSFNNLMGSYDWKLYNLFGYNFTESALLSVKQIITQFVIIENSLQRTKLKDIRIGKIDGIDVKVNIPEKITSITYLKPMLEYIMSRISTIIANGSMDTISKDMQDIFRESVLDKIKIKP